MPHIYKYINIPLLKETMAYVCYTAGKKKWHLLNVLLQYKKAKYLKVESLYIDNFQ